jgi:hypothetical protein
VRLALPPVEDVDIAASVREPDRDVEHVVEFVIHPV